MGMMERHREPKSLRASQKVKVTRPVREGCIRRRGPIW